MRVDQARHENAPAAIHHGRAFGRGAVCGIHRDDLVALDQNLDIVAQAVRLAVKQFDLSEQDPGRCAAGLGMEFFRGGGSDRRCAQTGKERAA